MRRTLAGTLAAAALLAAPACSDEPPQWPPATSQPSSQSSSQSSPQPELTPVPAAADTPRDVPGDTVPPAVAAARARVMQFYALPGASDLQCVIRISPPYAILQQVDRFTEPDELRKNVARLAKGQQVAVRGEILLTELHRRFRELFAGRFALPDLSAHGRTLLAFVGWERPALEQAYRAANDGEHLPSYYRSIYSRPAQTLFTCVGHESLRAQDEVPVAGDRIQKESDQSLLFEGTLQLLHEYGAIVRGHPLVDGDREDAPTRSAWFRYGLAEFMSAVEVDRVNKATLEHAEFRHNRLAQGPISRVIGDGRLLTYRDLARTWTLTELMEPDDDQGLLRTAARLYPADRLAMAEMFSARSWGLVSFLWNYDHGRYRGALLDTMDAVLHGRDAPNTLARCLGGPGGPGANDWARVEQEYEWYWDRCLARRFGWRDAGHTLPWNTETDPPEGTLDE